MSEPVIVPADPPPPADPAGLLAELAALDGRRAAAYDTYQELDDATEVLAGRALAAVFGAGGYLDRVVWRLLPGPPSRSRPGDPAFVLRAADGDPAATELTTVLAERFRYTADSAVKYGKLTLGGVGRPGQLEIQFASARLLADFLAEYPGVGVRNAADNWLHVVRERLREEQAAVDRALALMSPPPRPA